MRECTSCMAFFNIDLDILQKNEKEQKICIIICSHRTEKLCLLPFRRRRKKRIATRWKVGYIVKKNQILSQIGQLYIEEKKRYFS